MILAIPLSLLLGTFGPATATDGPLFAAPFLSFDTGSGTFPHSIAIGDLNGDGKPDLVAADDFISAVSVLLGNGDGTFGPNRYYETGHQPRSASIGDVNGDGKLDIVTASQGAEAVSVLLGNGDGTFGPKNDYAAGGSPQWVAIGDLNGDGKPDLATANGNTFPGTVSVLLGSGDGSFGPKSDFVTGYSAWFVAIGDLNADGKPDLATANYYVNTVSVLLGNGDGSFGPNSDYGTGDAPSCVAIGDLNGDGKPDLAVASYNSSAVSVLSGTGTGPSERRTTTGRLQVHTPW